jgi:hypothetical protein
MRIVIIRRLKKKIVEGGIVAVGLLRYLNNDDARCDDLENLGEGAIELMHDIFSGRGCLGKPWLFRELTQAFAGQPIDAAPSLGDVVEVMRRHLALLVAYKRTPQLGVRAFRKHLGWYLTGFAVGPSLRRALMDADTAAELDPLFDALDPQTRLSAAARDLPRGHLHGPRPVALPAGWRESADDPKPPRGAELAFSGG